MIHIFSQNLFGFTLLNFAAFSKADNSHGWEPSISLSADLDEPQKFGFCLDFFGAFGSLTCGDLQARSCKRVPGDTQFEYYLPTKAIRPANYNFNCEPDSNPSTRGCVKVSDFSELISGAPLSVGMCNATDEKQIFDIVESGDNYELHIGEDLCLAVGDTSRSPGAGAPPLARVRDLSVTTCSSLPGVQKTWTIKPKPNSETQTNAPTATPVVQIPFSPFLFIFFNFFWDPFKNFWTSNWLDFMN